ncbi:hypothetical protein IE4872_CH01095 [Rhizobium gallicum]|uniref:Uncharacterized protein n=1 Tax=Rhizobium gallicum TaxID=56730 RepID=A0A1L5NFQ0_9HYPH|nr:hypothetical protein IE4872_CH01095 [Rhizobium gallicum]
MKKPADWRASSFQHVARINRDVRNAVPGSPLSIVASTERLSPRSSSARASRSIRPSAKSARKRFRGFLDGPFDICRIEEFEHHVLHLGVFVRDVAEMRTDALPLFI